MRFDVYFKDKAKKEEWELKVFDVTEDMLAFTKSIKDTHEIEMYQHVEVNMFVLNSKTMEVRTVKEVKRNSVVLNMTVGDLMPQRDDREWCRREKEWFRDSIMVVEEVNYIHSRKFKDTCVELSGNSSTITIPVNNTPNKKEEKEKPFIRLDPYTIRHFRT